MKSFNFVVKDELGIHARPAGIISKEAKKFESTIKITKGEKTVTASQLLMLMSLGVKKGEEVIITVEGSDENEAFAAIKTLFNSIL